jgi:hypothetical protein
VIQERKHLCTRGKVEFAYHNAYVFQGLVPSIVIFWSAQLRTQNLHKEGCIALRWESSIQKRHSHHHESRSIDRINCHVRTFSVDPYRAFFLANAHKRKYLSDVTWPMHNNNYKNKNVTVIITKWFTVTMHPCLKWQCIFSSCTEMFSFLYHRQYFYKTWMLVTRQMSYNKTGTTNPSWVILKLNHLSFR